MTNLRTIALACALAALLPGLLAPSSAAISVDDAEPLRAAFQSVGLDDEADAACGSPPPYQDIEGYAAIKHLGSFRAHGSAVDGCGGQNCDDRVDGYYYSGGPHAFHVVETGWDNTDACGGSCWAEGAEDTTTRHPYVVFFPDGSDVDPQPHVYFACGTNDDPAGWVFGGRLYFAPCDAAHNEPACTDVLADLVG